MSVRHVLIIRLGASADWKTRRCMPKREGDMTALEWHCSGRLMWVHIPVDVHSEAKKDIRSFIKGPVCHMARSLIKVNFSLHLDKVSIKPDADVHLRGCVSRLSMYKRFMFCSDLLNTSRTGVLKRTPLHHPSKRVSSGLLDTTRTHTQFLLLLKPYSTCLAAIGLYSKHTCGLGWSACGRWHMGTDRWKVLVPCWWQRRSQISTLMAAPCRQHLPHPAKACWRSWSGELHQLSLSLSLHPSLKHQVLYCFPPHPKLYVAPFTANPSDTADMREYNGGERS